MLIQTPPLLGQDCCTRAKWIRPSKTAVQNPIHQGAALAHGQTCMAQASHNGAEQIGGQVIWRAALLRQWLCQECLEQALRPRLARALAVRRGH